MFKRYVSDMLVMLGGGGLVLIAVVWREAAAEADAMRQHAGYQQLLPVLIYVGSLSFLMFLVGFRLREDTMETW